MTGIPFKNCDISLTKILFVGLLFLSPLACAAPPPIDPSRAQFLPITANAEIKGKIFNLETAQTIEQQSQGLMFRPPLPKNQGMLFPFMPPRVVAFWMMNTPVPLDIVFLHKGKVQAIAMAVPCTNMPCPVYPPKGIFADMVIELRAGTTRELGLKLGDRVIVKENLK